MSGRRAADVSSPVSPLDVLRPDAVLGVWLLFLFLMRQRRRKDDVVLDRLPSPSSSVDISFLSSLLISTVLYGSWAPCKYSFGLIATSGNVCRRFGIAILIILILLRSGCAVL